jgi:hypothetical protein
MSRSFLVSDQPMKLCPTTSSANRVNMTDHRRIPDSIKKIVVVKEDIMPWNDDNVIQQQSWQMLTGESPVVERYGSHLASKLITISYAYLIGSIQLSSKAISASRIIPRLQKTNYPH